MGDETIWKELTTKSNLEYSEEKKRPFGYNNGPVKSVRKALLISRRSRESSDATGNRNTVSMFADRRITIKKK